MSDDFLRRVRPVPRAAFVHELKAKLDRQSPALPLMRRASILRTLVVALLIGGAAFAVTMMSSRHEAVVERAAPAPLTPTPAGDATLLPPPEQARDEITPFTPRNVRHEVTPVVLAPFANPPDSVAGHARAPNTAAPAEPSPAPQVVSGIAFGGGAGLRSIDGAGASFPLRLYDAWGITYRDLTGVSVEYWPVASGSGVMLLEKKQITFAATDIPLHPEELKRSGMFQFPTVVSAVVPVVHLSGIVPSQLALDGPTLASIYLGEITRWDDARIRKLNPALTLPGTAITLLVRADNSTATYLFTEYLTGASMPFQSRYGVHTQIDVSPGTRVRGDDGMAEVVGRTDGAIGYLDYNYARSKTIQSVRLINKAARIVSATPESLQSAVAHADWAGAPGLAASLADMPGEQSWPIVGASYILVRTNVDPTATAAVFQFFDWGYRNGSKTAGQLGFVTMPAGVAELVRSAWNASVKGAPKSPQSPGG